MNYFPSMSAYLETILNPDQPVLAVGPGVCINRDDDDLYLPNENGLYLPMDIAILWFSEHLRGRNGRIDVFDLPEDIIGGTHAPSLVRGYLDGFTKRIDGAPLSLREGDIASADMASEQYGLLWDHGTLSYASEEGCKYIRQRETAILDNYFRMTKPGGKIILVENLHMGPYRGEEWWRQHPGISTQEVKVKADAYKTSLTGRDISGVDDFLSDGVDDFLSEYLDKGFLIPYYQLTHVTEITKKEG